MATLLETDRKKERKRVNLKEKRGRKCPVFDFDLGCHQVKLKELKENVLNDEKLSWMKSIYLNYLNFFEIEIIFKLFDFKSDSYNP